MTSQGRSAYGRVDHLKLTDGMGFLDRYPAVPLSEEVRTMFIAGHFRMPDHDSSGPTALVGVSNPIEFLSTEEVWTHLLQKPNPWGVRTARSHKLYARASNGKVERARGTLLGTERRDSKHWARACPLVS